LQLIVAADGWKAGCVFLVGSPVRKCVVLQVNDAAVMIRLVEFVSKVQGFYMQITEQTGWGRGERRGVPPL
jgi:hypothetical protein